MIGSGDLELNGAHPEGVWPCVILQGSSNFVEMGEWGSEIRRLDKLKRI